MLLGMTVQSDGKTLNRPEFGHYKNKQKKKTPQQIGALLNKFFADTRLLLFCFLCGLLCFLCHSESPLSNDCPQMKREGIVCVWRTFPCISYTSDVRKSQDIFARICGAKNLFGRSGSECAAVITFARKDLEPFATNADFESVVINLAFAFGSKSEGVLIASFFGDAGVELVEGIALSAVINIAAGVFGIADEAREFAIEVTAASGNGIYGNIITEQAGQSFVVAVGVELRAILTIADQKNNFTAFAGTFF